MGTVIYKIRRELGERGQASYLQYMSDPLIRFNMGVMEAIERVTP
jgi:hypothetical protein